MDESRSRILVRSFGALLLVASFIAVVSEQDRLVVLIGAFGVVLLIIPSATKARIPGILEVSQELRRVQTEIIESRQSQEDHLTAIQRLLELHVETTQLQSSTHASQQNARQDTKLIVQFGQEFQALKKFSQVHDQLDADVTDETEKFFFIAAAAALKDWPAFQCAKAALDHQRVTAETLSETYALHPDQISAMKLFGLLDSEPKSIGEVPESFVVTDLGKRYARWWDLSPIIEHMSRALRQVPDVLASLGRTD